MPDPRFAPVEIGADLSALPASERRALRHLVGAARVMDALFLRQVWSGNETLLQALARDDSPRGRELLHAFLLNKGPWSRLDHHAPFVPEVPEKPGGANFYPGGMTRDEVSRWLDTLAAEQRADATGFFTTIRRSRDGSLTAVPYSVEYRPELEAAADLLRAAASETAEPTLARYLRTRADAFLSDDYFESDVAWMELDSAIEPVIGPYEVYEDEWFNYKAAFEAVITVRDADETSRLASYASRLQALEDALPIDPRYRNPRIGGLTPIRVVNVVFNAGDANRGVQTAAFNLPNDERVIRAKGSKSVMLKNVQEAKFRTVLEPIASRVLAPEARGQVTVDAFFTHILLHELMHGLGPHDIVVDGVATTVRARLKDAYSAIEEAKADVSGLWAATRLAARGDISKALLDSMFTTFLASMFRSLRFGINEAHGRGVAIQFNHFLRSGAVRVRGDGRVDVVPGAMHAAVESLTAELMTLQAEGSYEKATAMIAELGTLPAEAASLLAGMSDIPVDIEPKYS